MAILEAVFADKAGQTPQEVERRRKMALALMKSGSEGKAPSSGLELAGRLAMTLTGQYQAGKAEQQDATNRASASKSLIDAVYGGGSPGGASQSPVQSQPQFSPTVAASSGPQSYRDAIASIESKGSGDYSAVGPTNEKLGRALGRYQIMEANIGPWSQEALGRAVTSEEFLADPKLQDAIFDHKFGGYVNQFGPEGAAQAWFAGPGGVGKTDRKDVLGTSVGEYGNKFAAALGASPATSADAVNAMAAGGNPQPTMANAYANGAPQPDAQPAQQGIPAEFAGSQQLANARGGIVPALMGGTAASPEQVAQARALGAAQPQPQQQGQDNRALIAELLGNPYTAEAGQQLLMQEMQRRQEANDPVRQMEMEKQRLELEAMRNPQADPLKVGEGETVIDPRTGQVMYQGQPKTPAKPSAVQEYEYAKEQGFPGTFQDWEASKKGGMSLQVDPATGAVTFQQGGNIKPMTEGQSKDTVFATRAQGSLPLIDEFGSALTGAEGLIGGTVGQLPVVGNYAKSEAFQKAEQAGKEFLQAILRKDTGAAITKEETAEYGSVYLPRPGDSPEFIEQKRASRLRALEAIKAGMPPQAILAQEKALAKTQQGTGPRQPIVIDGYTIEEVE